MKKLALCFLVYDRIQCEPIWEPWILSNRENVKVFIHSKLPLQIESQSLKENITQIESIETKWGDFSLVEATLLLYKEAIKDSEVEYCILLSGSCIPIKSFQYVYEHIMNGCGKSFSNIFGSGNLGLGNTKFPIAREFISKHEQWIILNRKHAEYVIDQLWRIKFIFKRKDSHPPDELWFNTFMKLNRMDNQIIYKRTTFTQWSKKEVPHPKTFETISDKELEYLLSKDDLFARKFVKDSFTESQISRIVCNNQNNS